MKFLILSSIVKNILDIPPSNIVSTFAFSAGRRVLDEKTTRLKYTYAFCEKDLDISN